MIQFTYSDGTASPLMECDDLVTVTAKMRVSSVNVGDSHNGLTVKSIKMVVLGYEINNKWYSANALLTVPGTGVRVVASDCKLGEVYVETGRITKIEEQDKQ